MNIAGYGSRLKAGMTAVRVFARKRRIDARDIIKIGIMRDITRA
jgi:hypothetical protein